MNNLKELREGKKMTQVELGNEIGVSGRSIGFYESGKRKPKLEVAIKIANFFDKSVKYVFLDLSKKRHLKKEVSNDKTSYPINNTISD